METVKKLFGTTDLYEVLKVKKDVAGDGKILKKAYMSAALKNHPDKGPPEEREIRTQKFQVIKKIYDLLQDADLRKSYEETGEWPGEEETLEDLGVGLRVDEQMILDYKKKYIGSEEERNDVKELYKIGKGSILHVLDNLFFANILDDEERVQGIIDELIEAGDMDKIGNGLVDEKARTKKINKAKKEAKEAEKIRKEMNMGDGMEGLRVALAKKASARSGFLDDLEEKYSKLETNGKGRKGRSRKSPSSEDEQSEEEEAPKAKKQKMEEPKKSSKASASEGAPKRRGRSAKNSK